MDEIMRAINARKAAGHIVQPWEVEAAYRANFGEKEKKRAEQRKSDITQTDIAQRYDLGMKGLSLKEKKLLAEISEMDKDRKASEQSGLMNMISSAAVPFLWRAILGGGQ